MLSEIEKTRRKKAKLSSAAFLERQKARGQVRKQFWFHKDNEVKMANFAKRMEKPPKE